MDPFRPAVTRKLREIRRAARPQPRCLHAVFHIMEAVGVRSKQAQPVCYSRHIKTSTAAISHTDHLASNVRTPAVERGPRSTAEAGVAFHLLGVEDDSAAHAHFADARRGSGFSAARWPGHRKRGADRRDFERQPVRSKATATRVPDERVASTAWKMWGEKEHHRAGLWAYTPPRPCGRILV